jgi:probable HAF family extracellular repeat protein
MFDRPLQFAINPNIFPGATPRQDFVDRFLQRRPYLHEDHCNPVAKGAPMSHLDLTNDLSPKSLARAFLFTALCIGAAASSPAFADTATFTPLTGVYYAMSRNGQYMVTKQTNGDFYRWSAATGQVNLNLGIGASGFISAISDDGSTLIGARRNASNITVAFRWTQAAGFTDIGDLPGGSTYSVATAMSADGATVVGRSASTASGTRDEGFIWTQATGPQPMGDLPGGTYYSEPTSISADGSVIVGISNQTAGYEAFRYTAATGMLGLGDIPGGPFNSQAYHVSSDGQTIVGYSSDSLSREQAVKWTQDAGLVPLGFASTDPNEWSQAHGVSGTGNLIVGNNNTGHTSADIKPLLWDPLHGMRYLTTAMTDDYALAFPPGWIITGGWDVSDNARIIGVAGYDPSNAYATGIITIVPEPTAGCLTLAATLPLLLHRRRAQRKKFKQPGKT